MKFTKQVVHILGFILFYAVVAADLALSERGIAEETKNIEDIDNNFKPAKVGDLEVRYYNALKEPFVVEGFPWRDSNAKPRRLPTDFTEKEVNGSALYLSRMTAGGVIRFRTDSAYVSLRAELTLSTDLNHMPRAASSGFDLYRGAGIHITYCRSIQPNHGQRNIEVLLLNGRASTQTDYTLYLPLYGSIDSIEIGLSPQAKLEPPTPHAIEHPVLFYGSSITQGCCASRAGNTYPAMLCRAIDAPMINLGFSGGALGEQAIARAIGDLKLSALLIDYDYNSPSLDALRLTHAPFFRSIRDRQPELPVIILSKCNFNGWQDEKDRRDVIRATVDNAANSGDKHVVLIDGELLFGKDNRDACTVDGTHPNDLGFYRMYTHILPVLQKIVNNGAN